MLRWIGYWEIIFNGSILLFIGTVDVTTLLKYLIVCVPSTMMGNHPSLPWGIRFMHVTPSDKLLC